MKPNAKKEFGKLRVGDQPHPFLVGPKFSAFVWLVNTQELVAFANRWKYIAHGFQPLGFLFCIELANLFHLFNGAFGNLFAFKFAQIRKFKSKALRAVLLHRKLRARP